MVEYQTSPLFEPDRNLFAYIEHAELYQLVINKG